jgi:hypothetical protein
MRKIQLLGLTLVAAMAFSALAAASAFAAPEWLSNGGAISTATSATQSGKVLLTDLSFGIAVECSGSGTGLVGPGATDVQETLTPSACTTVKGSCSSPSAVAVGLPWTTSLKENAKKEVEDSITSKSGYQVTCSGVIKDTCESAASAATVLVTQITAVVKEEFPVVANEKIAKCSLGGAEAGDVSGKFEVVGTNGDSVSVS